jgi:radical SAM/Cys-rich protein
MDRQASGVALEVLNAWDRELPRVARPFHEALADCGLWPLASTGLRVLQVNLGKRCNQSCEHCHVDAGPDREEVMPDEVVDAVLKALEASDIGELDITGGAPELHPRFTDLVDGAHGLGRHVVDRCNLTVLSTPKYARLVPFLAERRVELICSLPSLNPRQTDLQRGLGVFDKSIAALRSLNEQGYGRSPELPLNLVTNPTGAFLPGDQGDLEQMWKRDLRRRWGVEFTRLYALTNMPIARFLDFLTASGHLDRYMAQLETRFNPIAAAGVMCRDMISVSWDGKLYDCDYNQMLEVPIEGGAPASILDFDADRLKDRTIAVGPHCYGCTAGQGSSCGGAVT